MKILVLGSEGVVGSSFCKEAILNSHIITKWDIKITDKHDLRLDSNLPLLRKCVDDSDFVLFTAYDVGGSKFLNTMGAETINNNMKIMSNVFSCLHSKKFIFCSSTMSNITNNSYGVSKRLGELYTESLNGITIKLWNIYGNETKSLKSHVITDFIISAVNTGNIKIMTSGLETRQLLHADDCAKAILTIFNNYNVLKSKIIDISSGEWISIRHIADCVKNIVKNVSISIGELEDNCHTILSDPDLNIISKLWKPVISLEQGIKKCIDDMIILREPTDHFTKNDIFQYHTYNINKIINQTIFGKGDSDKHLMTIFSMVLQIGALNVLELGVRHGATTLPLLSALKINGGTLLSVDKEKTSFVPPEDLADIWTFVQDDAINFLSKQKPTKPWDLIFIDDWHSYEHVKKELEFLDFQITPSTIILLHDLMYANYQPHYHSDIAVRTGQWANGGPYRAVAELNPNFWEFMTIPANNGLTILRKKYSGLSLF